MSESTDEIPNKQQMCDNGHSQINRNVESPRIFKLNIDCFDELLEYLSTKDLLALSQTCKTMQKVVGVYARDNYSEAAKIDKDIINCKVFSRQRIESAETSGFNQFTIYIHQSKGNARLLNYIESHSHEFKSVKHLYLDTVDLIPRRINQIKNILNQLEIIQLRYCTCGNDFYESFLRYCVNLKRLIMCDHRSIIKQSGNDWLQKVYPSLEHLELKPLTLNVGELIRFFQLNPNVRSFSTSSEFLLKNQIEFVKSGIKLDILQVKMIYGSIYQNQATVIFNLLNRLYDQRFYKLLHFYAVDMNKDSINQMKSLRGLEKLCIEFQFDIAYKWPLLPSVKDLGIMGTDGVFDAEILTQGLVNLERLHIQTAYNSDIRTFIRYSPKLKQIILKDAKKFNGIIRKISMLNQQREKLKNAQKVTIYVSDDIFVANKWIATQGDLNLSLVEIKRCDSYRWDHRYEYFYY